jgi:hypothetical protein
VERLIREKDAVLSFAFNEDEPFTNNLAEIYIRPAKVKQKVSNCFRTFPGQKSMPGSQVLSRQPVKQPECLF